MNFNLKPPGGKPSMYAISPESIQPQYIAPETIQPQYIPPYYPEYPTYPPRPPYYPEYPSYPPRPPYPYPPMPPYPYPSRPVGGCQNKWARVRLRDGRTLNIYVTSIAEQSIGGFLPNGRQIALDVNEIVEMTC